MKHQISLIFSTIIISLFFGCASSYNTIHPPTINYSATNLEDSISFSYRYDVLSEAGNRKYAKRERSRGLKVVSVKITNFTGKKINLAKDFSFYTGNRVLYPSEPRVVKNELKQASASYLLYLLLSPTNISTYSSTSNGYGSGTTSTHVYPVGLILGPSIAIGNMLVASSANKNLFNELSTYSINVDVEHGQTVYCLLGFRDIGYDPLTLKRNK